MNLVQERGHQYLPSAALRLNSTSTSNTQPRIIRNSVLRRKSPVIVQGSRTGTTTAHVIPNLQKARCHLAGSIASIKPLSCDVSRNNCNEKRQPDTTGKIRVLENLVEPRLPVGELLRRFRMNEQKPVQSNEYRGRAASGTSKDEVFFENPRNAERKVVNHVLEQKEKKSSVRKEMEIALQYRITENDQDIDDEVYLSYPPNVTIFFLLEIFFKNSFYFVSDFSKFGKGETAFLLKI